MPELEKLRYPSEMPITGACYAACRGALDCRFDVSVEFRMRRLQVRSREALGTGTVGDNVIAQSRKELELTQFRLVELEISHRRLCPSLDCYRRKIGFTAEEPLGKLKKFAKRKYLIRPSDRGQNEFT
jgi:hypothetical protein